MVNEQDSGEWRRLVNRRIGSFIAAAFFLAASIFPAVVSAATVAATYEFADTFAADEAAAPALTPVDPEGLSVFQTATVLGQTRSVWTFNGTNSPPDQQAGLTLNTAGLLAPESYSVEMVCQFTARDGAWRRLLDVQNRQADTGFYVDPSNHLDVYTVAGSATAWTNNVYHHVVLTCDGANVSAYLDGVAQFTAATTLLNLDADPTDNPDALMGFFLDNVVGGGIGEWSPGSVALIRVWNGVLDASDVQTQAANPFAGGMQTVAIVSPPVGTELVAGATLPLAASILNPTGDPSTVQFFIDGTPVDAAITSAPFVASTTVTTPGTYTLSAVLYDSQGHSNFASEMFTVVAANPDAPAPTVALDTPLAGRNLVAGSTQTVTFEAAPGGGTASPDLTSVSLYADGALVAAFDGQGNPVTTAHAPSNGRPTRRDAAVTPTATVFQTPYQLPGTDKLVNLIAVALDALGQTTVSSVATVHATVTNDVPPQAVFSGLDNGASVFAGDTYALTINSQDAVENVAFPSPADSGTLALLEYYIGQVGHSLGAAPPYAVNFQPPTAGKYVLHAVATDSAGLASISEPLIVDAVAPPTVSLAVGGTGAAVEGGAKGVVVVTRTGDTSQPLTVSYKVKGAAQAGVDYKPLPGSITIPAGATGAKIKVKAIDGSPNAGVLKIKFALLPSTDGSYTVGTSPIKLKLIGK